MIVNFLDASPKGMNAPARFYFKKPLLASKRGSGRGFSELCKIYHGKFESFDKVSKSRKESLQLSVYSTLYPHTVAMPDTRHGHREWELVGNIYS